MTYIYGKKKETLKPAAIYYYIQIKWKKLVITWSRFTGTQLQPVQMAQKFNLGKAGESPTWYLLIFFSNFLLIFFISMCWITFSSHLDGLKQLHGKVSSRQYKRGIPLCRDETFYFQDPGKTRHTLIPVNRNHVIITIKGKCIHFLTTC